MIRLSITPVAALLGCALLCDANSTQASMVYYDFNGAIDYGSLVGETYAGHFSFNDAGLAHTGFESVTLKSLSFNFLASNFGLANAAATATADFQDCTFLGVSYTVNTSNPTFSLYSGSLDTSDAGFAYTPSSGVAGYGSVTFTATVPEPEKYAMMLLGAAMVSFQIKRKQK
jgi:hypothetical protein